MSGSNQSKKKNKEGWYDSHGRGDAISVRDNLSENRKLEPSGETWQREDSKHKGTEHLMCSRNGKDMWLEQIVQEKNGKTLPQREWKGRFYRVLPATVRVLDFVPRKINYWA